MFEALSRHKSQLENETIIFDFAREHIYGNGSDITEHLDELKLAVIANELLPYYEYFKAVHFYYLGKSILAEEIYKNQEIEKVLNPCLKGFVLLYRGSNYRSLGELDKSISFINSGLNLLQKSGVLNDYRVFGKYQLGSIYVTLGEFEKAKSYFKKALQLNQTLKTIASEYRINEGLGKLHLNLNQLETAYDYLKRAEEFSKGKLRNESNSFHDLAQYFYQKNQCQKALEVIDEAIKIRTSINLEDATSTSLILKAKILLLENRIEEAIELLEITLIKVRLNKTQLKEKDCLTLLSDAYEWKGDVTKAFFYLKKFDSLQTDVFFRQQKEIQKKQTEYIQEQNNKLVLQNKEIKESINYSRRLQNAILPPKHLIEKHFPKSFVYYQPKDIVAGDFYWISTPETRTKNFGFEDVILFAAADCTGHGVPGAIVSFICSDILNRSVDEHSINNPAKLLDKTFDLLINRFILSSERISDGMDISVVSFNTKTLELKWAGANNPLFYIKNNKFSFIKGDKQSIGYSIDPKPFNNHSISLSKGDRFFLGTDGYPDQFGGPKGKKLGSQKYKEILETYCPTTINEMSSTLHNDHLLWKGLEEQLDDICIVGVEV